MLTWWGIVETRIKEPIFIKTLRLKFNFLNPLNMNLPEADPEEGSYITGFMSSELLKIFKNYKHSDQNSLVVRQNIRFLT